MKAPIIGTVVLQYPSRYHDYPIDLIRNRFPTLEAEEIHEIDLPILCHASKNPGAGSTLSIRYCAGETFLELFALENYINGFINHMEVRDIEYLVQVVALETAHALKVPVEVTATVNLAGLNQRQIVRIEASPEALSAL